MPNAPYDTVTTVLNVAKVRLNDAIETLDPVNGNLINNTQAFSQQVVNIAWRREQECLVNLGYSRFKIETLLANVPATGSSDPATQSYISWSAYFDGVGFQASPVLPQDMIAPLELWERAAGSTDNMIEMGREWNGLPKVPKTTWQKQWEWRDDMVFIPGALGTTDIMLRYAAYLGDFVDNSPAANTPWYAQVVPILRCVDSFALFICDEMDRARGGQLGAAGFGAEAERMASLVLDRDTLQPKSIYKTSEFSKMSDRYTPASGPNTQPVKRMQ